MLQRRLGLAQATAINMIDMVGIGPFITLHMVIGLMGGPYFLYAWLAGALLSFLDAMVWSELGAAFPQAGGSYNFLKQAYGPNSGGKLMSFLFVWQTMIQAPLVIASAAIGFSDYASYFFEMSLWQSKAVSGGLVMVIVFALYRRIETIGKISVLLWVCVMATFMWIIGGALAHGNFASPLLSINEGLNADMAFAVAMGAACVKCMYSYLGYYNVCHLGGEITHPAKNIPRSMFLSIAGISVLYLALNISVASVVPWQEAMNNKYVVSLFMERLAGNRAAGAITVLILIVAFASVFSATLGYSRIPYAAARDGSFFKAFGKLHPQKQFPHVSLLFLGATAFVFSLLFRLSDVISAILAMRILVQFIGQGVGLMLLRKKLPGSALPYKMPLYPLPVIVGVILWAFVLISTGPGQFVFGCVAIACGLLVYLIKAKTQGEWPFVKITTENN